MSLQGHRGRLVLAGFVLAKHGTSPTKQGPGYLLKVAGPWKESAWVSMRDVQAGESGAGDTSLSMPRHVETLDSHVQTVGDLHVELSVNRYSAKNIWRYSGLPASGAYLMVHIHIYIS